MEAAKPAVIPAGGGADTGLGVTGGLIPVLEWGDFKAKARRILLRSTDQARCMERMKERADDLIHDIPGEIGPAVKGEVMARYGKGKHPADCKDFSGKESDTSLDRNSLLISNPEDAPTVSGAGDSFLLREIKGREGNQGRVELCIIRDNGEIKADLYW